MNENNRRERENESSENKTNNAAKNEAGLLV